MGLFDTIKAQAANLLGATAGSGEAAGDHGLTAVVIEAVKGHGLGDLLQQFQAGGLREVVASWVGPGANLPVSAEQLEGALGRETLEKLASRFGVPPEQAAAVLSQLLPHAVDHLTPDGRVDSAGEAPAESEPGAGPESEPTER